jgi:LPPG:FO 2-phospho-L-lactate transferase
MSVRAEGDTAAARGPVIALSGGIGGAKLALGLSRVLAPEDVIVVANTGDDFEHLGLSISPDIDTLVYTLAGLANPFTGWGRDNETWTFMAALQSLGGETWFRLGDGDLAMHVERTRRLRAGEGLTRITADICARLGIHARVLPMSDDPVRTRLRTAEGWLDFQDYFVRRQCAPVIEQMIFDGADRARANPDILAALNDPHLRAVVICPSNPFISIDPILAVPGLRDAIARCRAPIVAVSPIIGGQAVKGPTAKMMGELGHLVTTMAVATHYGGLLDGYVIDWRDDGAAAPPGLRTISAATLMLSLADRENLARTVIDFADSLSDERRAADGASVAR